MGWSLFYALMYTGLTVVVTVPLDGVLRQATSVRHSEYGSVRRAAVLHKVLGVMYAAE